LPKLMSMTHAESLTKRSEEKWQLGEKLPWDPLNKKNNNKKYPGYKRGPEVEGKTLSKNKKKKGEERERRQRILYRKGWV